VRENRRILEELRREDEAEETSKGARGKKDDGVDLRKIKINKQPMECRPDPKLKNMVIHSPYSHVIAFQLRRRGLLVPEGLRTLPAG
jgi:hypothetical protein